MFPYRFLDKDRLAIPHSMTDKSIQKAKKACSSLTSKYGQVVSERKLPPIDELVMTILSQHTSDNNMYKAFESLKSRYAKWEQVLEASQDELADVIRSSGMFNLKAKRIQSTLREINQRVGKLDLSLLENMSLQEAKTWLTSLHGVGPKTAAIVLLFSFRRPTLPVDTHVWRVTKRLGLIGQNESRERAHELLEQIVPRNCILSFNNNLVRHGREVCKALRPQCEICFLSDICDYYGSIN
jgi:endonuclease-3